ncbi:hypothetical protein, partial [Pseudoalteromonas marina]
TRAIKDDPTYQDFENGMAKDYADCVKDTTFDKASDGYLLSCDGAERVDITSQCTEIVTCIQEQDTIITSVAKCDAYIPLAYQTCRVDIPSGSCEVFLEHTEQICDNITPNGECVKDLVNAIKICETFIPNGTCNNALEVSQPACIFSIPEGSCNMEKVLSTTTCTNTVKQGECNRELETFVKTCDVDVEETKECVETINVTESDCNAVASYSTQACESTRTVSEHSCSVKYTITSVAEPAKCLFKDGHRINIDMWGNPSTDGSYRIYTCEGDNTYKMTNYTPGYGSAYVKLHDIKTLVPQAKVGRIQIELDYEIPYSALPPYAYLECNNSNCIIYSFWADPPQEMFTLPYSTSTSTTTISKTNTCSSLESA